MLPVFICLLAFAQPVADEVRWERMDARFNEAFLALSDRPLELEAHGRRLLINALEAEDCEAALVAHSVIQRSLMMLRKKVSREELALVLPSGCMEDFPRLNYDLGCRLLEAGHADVASGYLLKATASTKWASHAWNVIGSIHAERAEFKEATQAWQWAQDAIEGIPNPSIFVNLGAVAARQGAWVEALHWFKLAWEAQVWNEQEGAYTFVYDIRRIIHANLLRAAVNLRDTAAADAAWQRVPLNPSGKDPLYELRSMLDYILWRNRLELIPGLVDAFEEEVRRDSLAALAALDDRVLLFAPWRQRSGWSLQRTADVLATAEQHDAVRHQVAIQPMEGAPWRELQAADVLWLGWGAWAVVLVLVGWAFAEALRYGVWRRNARRIARSDLAYILKELAAQRPERQVPGVQLVHELIHRLEESSLAFRFPKEVLDQMSPRELQVLQGIAKGSTSQAIAAELGITTQSVYNIRSQLRVKLGLQPGMAWESAMKSTGS